MNWLLMVLVASAALYGTLAGALVPGARYRLSVEPNEPWRTTAPCGHALGGGIGGGRCAACGRARYGPGAVWPAGAAAVMCAVTAAAVGPRPELAVWLLVIPVGLVLAGVDWAVHRLPDVLTLPLAGSTAVLLGLATLLPASGGTWTGSLLGAVTLGGAYLLLFLAHPAGMGFGDVKLAAGLGCALGWYGWGVLILGGLAGLLLGSVYGLALLLTRRAGRGTTMPLGPFLLAGAWLALLAGGWSARP
ncbi:prepilin peptidase [Streptomyces huiliensis]|uniref:prepilin peptidase n=1 Tax=Streptomyces huiliensis TaxID=2876027 RepID=UPI001CBD7241|nr:A24 family peptidase [Streptomyces huiliensis]MBZ4318473.1 A24 family peptidase [Streptomyces huiliensis]